MRHEHDPRQPVNNQKRTITLPQATVPAASAVESGQPVRAAPLPMSTSAPVSEETQTEQAPLVRLLPRTPEDAKRRTTPLAGGQQRQAQQSDHYPAELLQLMASETSKLRTLAQQPPAAASRPRRHRKHRRVPEIRQLTAVECGAACLAMILNYYGHAASLGEVQERCGAGRDGLTALEIVKAARLYGLRVRAVSLDLDDFRFVSLPAIVHWEFNHFLLVERWSRTHVDVIDPALGRRRLTPAEFDAGFTGVALMLEPGAQFEQKARQPALSLWSYIRSFLRLRAIMLQILGASLLLQVLGLGGPFLTEVVIDHILPEKNPNMLLTLALGMLILVLMQGVTMFLRSSLLIYLQTRIDTNMMLNFFEHLLSLPYRFFQLRLSGDLLARMNSNLAIRDVLTNQLISTLLDGGTVIVYALILFALSKMLAGIALAIGLVQMTLLLFTAPAMRRLTRRDLEAQGKTQGYMNEVLAGIATVKAAGAEQRVFNRWESHFFNEMNVSLRLSYLSSVVSTFFMMITLLAPLLLLWVGALQVLAGMMSIGTMLALNLLAVQLLVPLSALAMSWQELQVARAHFARISDVASARPEQDLARVQSPPRLKGYIELKHVSFQYAQDAPLILRDINLRILPGQKVALVGRTGSGKSTLGKLLVGLMTPTAGSIFFDGQPLEQLNYQEVRAQFGSVLQDAFVFSGSLKENIALNNPELDMERIKEAAHIAAIASDIENMPMGYDTLVSEGGSALSGGQRQRLALARALANHPALLLLDEATSALDVVTERLVEQNLSTLPCVQIIIAHRLSTIRHADLILVLDQGSIVEQGTHQQLLRRNGYYARLIQYQLQA